MDANNSGIALIGPYATELSTMAVEPSESFVVTTRIERITRRAMAYLDAGYPVHLSGPPGTGKTTLALHLAALRGRPVTLLHGDDEFRASDLVGSDQGFRRSTLVDNYVRSVVKTEETVNRMWTDNQLTAACKHGNTLVYDEFTRSRPEANNALLSVLEEGLLSLPRSQTYRDGYMAVDPRFRAVLTSNPGEYAGVHETQDALLDRLITIRVEYPDRDTEVRICAAKSGMSLEDSARVVDVVRALRELKSLQQRPSPRAGIMISTVARREGARPVRGDSLFEELCLDVLGSLMLKGGGCIDLVWLSGLIDEHMAPNAQRGREG
jgi:nitric oxide reductase NorQ protein